MALQEHPHRLIKFRDRLPTFPRDVDLHVELGPKELFGEAELTGRLHLHPPGKQVTLSEEMLHGGIRARSTGRLPRPKLDGTFFDLKLRLEGNLALVHGHLSDGEALRRCVDFALNHLPGMFATALHEPVYVLDAYGNVGEAFFQVEVRGTDVRMVEVRNASSSIGAHMELLARLPAAAAERVFAAQRYLNQAYRLGYAAEYPHQFAAERMLNLAKALEALFPCDAGGSGSVDTIRRSLKSLGLNTNATEVLCAIVYVRNQVDVGHAKLHNLALEQYATFHELALSATAMMPWLVARVVQYLADERHTLRPVNQADQTDLVRTMAKAADALKGINACRPNTFLEAAAPIAT